MQSVSRARRDLSDEGGFSLLEMVIALGVLFVVLAGLAHQMTSAFGSVLFARQRQVATVMANELLEQVRALPYDSIAMGNVDLAATVATDPELSFTGSGSTLTYHFRGRDIVRAELASQPPLTPHIENATGSDSTPYTRAVYVTESPADPAVLLVTARVSWTQAENKGAQSLVEVETLVSEHACTAQEGPRPCESYWYTNADAAAATVQVTGAMPGRDGIDVLLSLAKGSTQIVTEQLSEVSSTGTAPSATAKAIGVSESTVGGGIATASADDSVTTSRGTYEGPVLTGPSSSVSAFLSAAGVELVNGTLTASLPSGATAGAAAAAVTAGQAPLMGGGVLDNDGVGQGKMSASQPGAASVVLALNAQNGNLGSASLFAAAASSNGAAGESDRQPGTDETISDDDTVSATTSRALGTVDFLGLPSAYVKPGSGAMSAWAGYLFRVSGWSAGATATAGPGAVGADSSRSQAGQVSYWNGTGYTTVNLASGSVAAVPVSVSVTVSGCTVAISGQLTAGGGTTTVDHEGGGGTGPISQATSVVNAPASGSFTYQVTCDAVLIADLTVDIDLGQTLAESRYATPGT